MDLNSLFENIFDNNPLEGENRKISSNSDLKDIFDIQIVIPFSK